MRPRRGPCASPSSAIRSVAVDRESAPVEDDVRRELVAIRARSSSSRPASAGSPDPTLSASRSSSSSSSMPSPTAAARPMNRRTAASDQFAS